MLAYRADNQGIIPRVIRFSVQLAKVGLLRAFPGPIVASKPFIVRG